MTPQTKVTLTKYGKVAGILLATGGAVTLFATKKPILGFFIMAAGTTMVIVSKKMNASASADAARVRTAEQ